MLHDAVQTPQGHYAVSNHRSRSVSCSTHTHFGPVFLISREDVNSSWVFTREEETLQEKSSRWLDSLNQEIGFITVCVCAFPLFIIAQKKNKGTTGGNLILLVLVFFFEGNTQDRTKTHKGLRGSQRASSLLCERFHKPRLVSLFLF